MPLLRTSRAPPKGPRASASLFQQALALLSENGRLREMFLLERPLERLTCQIDHEPYGKSLHPLMVPLGYLLMKVSAALTLVAYPRELALPSSTSILMGTSNTNLLSILFNLG